MNSRLHKKPYKPEYMVSLARELRRKPTPAENALWLALRKKEFFGCHFRRQAPFGRYIFDFYCVRKKVAIEVDGSIHEETMQYDKIRDEIALASGITVLRFSNDEVLDAIERVLSIIKQTLHVDYSFPPP